MSTERPAGVMVRDLIDEAKKRIVFLIVSLVGLSYLMSLTSSSVLVNLPAAAVLIVIVRYLALDFDMRKKAAVYKSKSSSFNNVPQKIASRSPNLIIERSDWRRKVNSPVVEDAIDKFTRHIVSEWITDMWYSKITPDRQVPEELVQIMNGVLGEISCRMRNINLIDLLTRDIIHLLCSHLELFQATKAKIDKQKSRSLSIEELDQEIKFVLSADNKLHPSLFSVEAEHKVLQHIMEGLISLTFKPEDLHCSFFRYIVRELLACAVMRPVLNLASPRFINERIESVVVSVAKAEKGTTKPEVESQPKPNGTMKVASNHISHFLDPSSKGVELVELKKDQLKSDVEKHETAKENGTIPSKDPLLCMETQSTRSWSSLPSETNGADGNRHRSGEQWGDMLDVFSRRKTEALAPEHFDNMWTKGRNYKSKGATDQSTASIQGSLVGTSKVLNSNKDFSKQKENGEIKDAAYNEQSITNKLTSHSERNSIHSSISSSILEDINEIMDLDEVESGNDGSYTTEDEEANNITGLHSPGVRVWDGKNRKNVTTIHHPLESIDGHKTRKARKGHARSQRLTRIQSGKKRSRTPQKGDVWQEVERTSFLVGDGKDILNSSKGRVKDEDSSEDSGAEMYSTISRGSSISSSLSSTSLPGSNNLVAYSSKSPVIADSFLTLRCEMLGANIVKSGSKSFAVYSISVTDMNNHSWSIKRRFRHFEELHRRLKEFPEYNLHLPPKHFLSTGVDVPVIQERCKLLDNYLKRLMNIHTVCSSIEVWDFLSVDSQTYIFSNSLSIIETLPVNLDNTSHERRKGYQNNTGSQRDSQSLRSSHLKSENADFILQTKSNVASTRSLSNSKTSLSSPKTTVKETVRSLDGSSSGSDRETKKVSMSSKNMEKTHNTNDVLHASFDLPTDTGYDPTLPSEWIPPNLSLPIFDLVDVIFQLQDGGWIRRNAFWVAKQVLQLGMGDAFDDWLIEKIQLLRKGSIVASGIGRIEQILWPDGIFITKHPRNHKPKVSSSTPPNVSNGQPTLVSSPKIEKLDDSQVKEAERRAKLVYELMIDRAPAAVVGLVGRKEYEQCAKYLYYFIQSSVVMKQLAYDILELILSSAFPELSDVFKELHEEKEKFGKLS